MDEILRPEPDYFRLGVDDPTRAFAILSEAGYPVEPEPSGPDMLRVRTPDGSVADANARLVSEGIRVIEINPVRPSLEEHFLRRTGGGDGDAE